MFSSVDVKSTIYISVLNFNSNVSDIYLRERKLRGGGVAFYGLENETYLDEDSNLAQTGKNILENIYKIHPNFKEFNLHIEKSSLKELYQKTEGYYKPAELAKGNGMPVIIAHIRDNLEDIIMLPGFFIRAESPCDSKDEYKFLYTTTYLNTQNNDLVKQHEKQFLEIIKGFCFESLQKMLEDEVTKSKDSGDRTFKELYGDNVGVEIITKEKIHHHYPLISS